MMGDEIIKALEWWITVAHNVGSITISKEEILAVNNLINHLQADKEALIAGQETLQKALAEKIEEVEQYKADKEEYMKDYAESENEAKFLKADRDFERQRAYCQLQENKFVRVEAIKEVVEKLKAVKTTAISCDLFEEVVRKSDIDNFIKEMTDPSLLDKKFGGDEE